MRASGDYGNMKRVIITNHKSRQAFTLVELIVVLVILAIIVAAIVPALAGYIKRAKREKYYDSAHYALTAAQGVMDELYGMGGISALDTSKTGNNDGGMTSDGNNINWFSGPNKKWGDKVLALMNRDRTNAPYILIIGVGYTPIDKPEASDINSCKVYYVAYLEDKNSPAVFYVNGEWRYKYPTDAPAVINKVSVSNGDGTNKITNSIIAGTGNGDQAIPLQMYVISNRDNLPDGTLWISGDKRSLRSHSEGHNGY